MARMSALPRTIFIALAALVAIALAAAGLAVGAAPEAEAQEIITITGVVEAGGVPQPNVDVLVGFGAGTTDENGRYTVELELADAETADIITFIGAPTADRPEFIYDELFFADADTTWDLALPEIVDLEVLLDNCGYNEAVIGCPLFEVFIQGDFEPDNPFGSLWFAFEPVIDGRGFVPAFAGQPAFVDLFNVDTGESFFAEWNGVDEQLIVSVSPEISPTPTPTPGGPTPTPSPTPTPGGPTPTPGPTPSPTPTPGGPTPTPSPTATVTPTPTPTVPTATVSGKVLAGGVPLPNVLVNGFFTDENGEFSVPVSDGRLFVDGFAPDTPDFTFETFVEDLEAPVTIELPPIFDLTVNYEVACSYNEVIVDCEPPDEVLTFIANSEGPLFWSDARFISDDSPILRVFGQPATIDAINPVDGSPVTFEWNGIDTEVTIVLPGESFTVIEGQILSDGEPLEGVFANGILTDENGEFTQYRTEDEPPIVGLGIGDGPDSETPDFFVRYSVDIEEQPVVVDLPPIIDLEVIASACLDVDPADCPFADGVWELAAFGGFDDPDVVFGDWFAFGDLVDGRTNFFAFGGSSVTLEIFNVETGEVFFADWNGEDDQVVLSLPVLVPITGQVLAGDVPLERAAVLDSRGFVAETDADGRFTVSIEADQEVVRVFGFASDGPDFAINYAIGDPAEPVIVQLPEIVDIEVILDEGCTNDEEIVGCDGTNLAASMFDLLDDVPNVVAPSDWSSSASTTTGSLTLEAFAGQSTEVRVFDPFVGELIASVVWNGSDERIIIERPEPVKLFGRVTAGGVPQAGVLINFGQATTDENGFYEVALDTDRSVVSFDSPEDTTTAWFVDLASPGDPTEDVELNLELPALQKLQFRLTCNGRLCDVDDYLVGLSGGLNLGVASSWTTSARTVAGKATVQAFDAPAFVFVSAPEGSLSLPWDGSNPFRVNIEGLNPVPNRSWYIDADIDGFGDAAGEPVRSPNSPGPEFVENNDDCDDSDPLINPLAVDIAGNGIDENCDGVDPAGGPAVFCLGAEVTINMRRGASGVGTPGNDVILGTSGADVIKSFGGDDKICAGSGDDTVNAGAGDDIVIAGAGNDTVFGLAGADDLRGGSGDDTIRGGYGADVIDGGPDDDNLWGNANDDVVKGGSGDDLIRGNRGADKLSGEAGADRIFGGPNADELRGGPDEDFITFEVGVDTVVNGGAGNDIFAQETFILPAGVQVR